MNGARDMGGVHGFGAVDPEPDEPVFHAEWERRTFALTLAMGANGEWSLDAFRSPARTCRWINTSLASPRTTTSSISPAALVHYIVQFLSGGGEHVGSLILSKRCGPYLLVERRPVDADGLVVLLPLTAH
jgi:hypothetical protein